jgi:hypothetical protein
MIVQAEEEGLGMSLSDFSDQFYSALRDYQIPEDSELGAGIKKAKDILQTTTSTVMASLQALQEIKKCFGDEAEAQKSPLVGKIHDIVNTEIGRIQKVASETVQGKPSNSLGVRLFSINPVQSSSAPPLSSVRQLVDGYKTREWDDSIPTSRRRHFVNVGGYLPRGKDDAERSKSHDEDRAFLEQVMQAHNQQFAEPIQQVRGEDEGFVEKLDVRPDEELYVRADLHSDLSSLLAQLEMLKASGHLDENYRCKHGFHMVFLGDYCDRGANDIEVLTLLLRLRMENPTSVHLIRGNHEDIEIQKKNSGESTWIKAHGQTFSDCYKSLPLALCVGVKNTEGNPQYVHFSHGAFSPAVNLEPLFKSDCSGMAVKKHAMMTRDILETRADEATQKQIDAFERLMDLPPAATEGGGYAWSNVAQRRDQSGSKRGYDLSVEDVHDYGRYAGGQSAVKAFFMGHVHEFRQWLVTRKGRRVGEKKVVVTTMPVGRPERLDSEVHEVRQGILLRTAPRVRDWTKRLAVSEGEKQGIRLKLLDSSCGMYDPFP